MVKNDQELLMTAIKKMKINERWISRDDLKTTKKWSFNFNEKKEQNKNVNNLYKMTTINSLIEL